MKIEDRYAQFFQDWIHVTRKSVFSRSSINEHKHTKLSILLFIFFELIILKDMIKDDIMNEYRQN